MAKHLQTWTWSESPSRQQDTMLHYRPTMKNTPVYGWNFKWQHWMGQSILSNSSRGHERQRLTSGCNRVRASLRSRKYSSLSEFGSTLRCYHKHIRWLSPAFTLSSLFLSRVSHILRLWISENNPLAFSSVIFSSFLSSTIPVP